MRSRLLSPPGRPRITQTSATLSSPRSEGRPGTGYERRRAVLFRPAGMRQTGYVLPHWTPARSRSSTTATDAPVGPPFDHPWAKNGPYWNLRGNGGIITTAPDMLRWERALLHHTSSATTPSANCSPRVYVTPPATATPTAGRSSPAPSARSRRTTQQRLVLRRDRPAPTRRNGLLGQQPCLPGGALEPPEGTRWSLTYGLLQAALPTGQARKRSNTR